MVEAETISEPTEATETIQACPDTYPVSNQLITHVRKLNCFDVSVEPLTIVSISSLHERSLLNSLCRDREFTNTNVFR